MAVAGLHNVSALDSSFLRESQSEVVRRQGDDGQSSNRPSSILQMWRELEDEHMLSHSPGRVSQRSLHHRGDGLVAEFSRVSAYDSHSVGHSITSEDLNGAETVYTEWSPSPTGSENGQDDSSDLGEVERERVRQIFQEWMSSSTREHAHGTRGRDNVARGEWLGETEQERVRIIREWVQMNSRQRVAHVDRRGEQGAEVSGQIEQVLNGSVVNSDEHRSDHTRRGIRRLCGRQALLDMLKKSERERKMELQGLLEHHAVSHFAHRNRIQSLLRGRFLRNDRLIENERQSSMAASEIGQLRQRHTVSDLRVGFFSRLDQSGSGQVSRSSSSCLESPNSSFHSEEINDLQTESCIAENGISWSSDRRVGIEDVNQQESAVSLEERTDNHSDGQLSVDADAAERGPDAAEEEIRNNRLYTEDMENEVGEDANLLTTREVFSLQFSPSVEDTVVHRLLNGVDGSQGTAVETADESNALLEQPQVLGLGSEDRDFLEATSQSNNSQGDAIVLINFSAASLHSSEQEIGDGDIVEEHQHENVANEQLEDENREEATDVWHENGSFQETVQSWLDEPSDQEAVPVRRLDPFYLPDNDNVYSTELRELLSRRSVSTLLRSGFRQSLDQLIRSYVERQSHASLDWEMQGNSHTPASAEQELDQQRDQNEIQEDAHQDSPFTLPAPSTLPVQQLWDHESHPYSWPQPHMHQQFGIEWDIINDLRIDMARLQQRMNHMQKMLEACMDMQLELQRSIRQEVAAALNRSACLSGTCVNGMLEDKSKWDDVRKGLCCICRSSSIDSLLYRCGHMCTCSTCANEILRSEGKCPMCWAPVIEVIRAYSIL